MANSHISQLVALITDAAKAIEAEFATSPVPEIPTLNSIEPHPLDLKPLKKLRENVRILEGACAQLAATVSPPIHTIMNKAHEAISSACLDVAVSAKIPDVLKHRKEGMHVSEISKSTGIEVGKLERILRYLSTTHIFREVKMGVFANNRLSIQLLEENTGYVMVKYSTEEKHRACSALAVTLADPVLGPSYRPEHAAWCRAFGYQKTFFNWHASEEGTQSAQLFGRYMIAFGQALGVEAAATDYPWQDLPSGSTVCDVGGGVGTVALQITKTHPCLKIKLQDIPGVLKYAEKVIWPKECPEALAENRVEFKAIDFLAESPIPGCDVYFLKSIMHDWGDEHCITILKNIRKVMKPESRVLINEHILRLATESSGNEEDSAPAPLLSNTGMGRIGLYNLDISMMVLVNAKERLLAEFVKIGEEAGLKLDKVWDSAGDQNIMEFSVANP